LVGGVLAVSVLAVGGLRLLPLLARLAGNIAKRRRVVLRMSCERTRQKTGAESDEQFAFSHVSLHSPSSGSTMVSPEMWQLTLR
jgi:hypothetical protein